MIKLLVNGACGQMGRTLLRMAKEQADTFLVLGGVDAFGEAEAEGFPVYKTLAEAPQDADAVIDFSRPEAAAELIAYARKTGARLVICTTGLGEAENKLIDRAAERIPIFQSGNMALGVNLQIELLKSAAGALGEKFDVEIVERHHSRKVDAPSGTALMLAGAISGEFAGGRQLVFGRHSKNQRRAPGEIGIHAVRGGTVVGEHEVAFYGQDEVLTITHQAFSKQVFAAGALRAAQYLLQKPAGRYDMHDLVTEHSVLSHLYTDEAQAIITLSSLPNEPGVLHAVFGAVAGAGVFVDMISMTSSNGLVAEISFSLPREQLANAMNALKGLRGAYMGMDIHALDNLTKVTVEGPGMAIRHGVASELFAALAEAGVGIELVTTSETKISCCIKNSDIAMALNAIAGKFGL